MNPVNSDIHPSDRGKLANVLREVSPFYYWGNFGNLGDLLIAEGARQLFEEIRVTSIPFNPDSPPTEPFNLVFAGGGRLVPHWGGIEKYIQEFTNPQVQKCVILPHSIYRVDELVRSFDSRHIIFCREKQSLDYIQSLNTQAAVYLAHDLGTQLNPKPYMQRPTPLPPTAASNDEERTTWALLQRGLEKKMMKAALRSSCLLKGKRYMFLMREDVERSSSCSAPFNFDISNVWNTSGYAMDYNATMMYLFIQALSQADVIVTDRLHVAVMAHLLKREVYMLDNDYGKLKGVYEVSLHSCPNVHYIGKSVWPKDIIHAWKRLNRADRKILFRLTRRMRRLRATCSQVKGAVKRLRHTSRTVGG